MPYLPGPLLLQNAANVGIETKDYDFAGFTMDHVGNLDVTFDGWQNFFDDATLLMDEPEDPYPDFNVNGALDVLNTYHEPSTLLGIADILSSMGVAAIGLSNAIGAAPAEAWQGDTAPFVAPAPALPIAVPEIPLGFLGVQVPNDSGTPPTRLPAPPPSIPSGVILSNLTALGSAQFTVGDTYQITATGPAGATIYVQASLNGQDLGSTYVGSIGDDGTFSTTGIEGVDAVGTWNQQWFVGGRAVGSFSFMVIDSE